MKSVIFHYLCVLPKKIYIFLYYDCLLLFLAIPLNIRFNIFLLKFEKNGLAFVWMHGNSFFQTFMLIKHWLFKIKYMKYLSWTYVLHSSRYASWYFLPVTLYIHCTLRYFLQPCHINHNQLHWAVKITSLLLLLCKKVRAPFTLYNNIYIKKAHLKIITNTVSTKS